MAFTRSFFIVEFNVAFEGLGTYISTHSFITTAFRLLGRVVVICLYKSLPLQFFHYEIDKCSIVVERGYISCVYLSLSNKI